MDDAKIFTKTRKHLEEQLKEMKEIAEGLRLEINEEKSSAVHLQGSRTLKTTAKRGFGNIQETKNEKPLLYKYLGLKEKIPSTCKSLDDIMKICKQIILLIAKSAIPTRFVEKAIM